MKLRATLSQLGLSWLDRLLPLFEKVSSKKFVVVCFSRAKVTLYARDNCSLFSSSDAGGASNVVFGGGGGNGVDCHADVDVAELFEKGKYRALKSKANDRICVVVDPTGLLKCVRVMISVGCNRVEMKLIKREVQRGVFVPALNFASYKENQFAAEANRENNDEQPEIAQDVALMFGGPLAARDVDEVSRRVDLGRLREVPYWLDMGAESLRALRDATERLQKLSPKVEVVHSRNGTVHLAAEKTIVVSCGVELRGVPVAPAEKDAYEALGGAGGRGGAGLAQAATAQMRLAEMRALERRFEEDEEDGMIARGILSAKQLGKGFWGTMTRPDVCFFGFAEGTSRLEMVHRFYSARRVVVDASTGTKEELQDTVLVRFRIPVELEDQFGDEDDGEGEDEEDFGLVNENVDEERRKRRRQLTFNNQQLRKSHSNDAQEDSRNDTSGAAEGMIKLMGEENEDDRDSFLDD